MPSKDESQRDYRVTRETLIGDWEWDNMWIEHMRRTRRLSGAMMTP